MVREHSKILNFRISDIFNYPVSYDVDNACKVILRQIFEISWTIIVKFNFKKKIKFNFLELHRTDFSKIVRGGRSVDCLSIYKFQENLNYGKNITVKFSKIWLGGPSSQAGPVPAKV